jgi:hypothetical protein
LKEIIKISDERLNHVKDMIPNCEGYINFDKLAE